MNFEVFKEDIHSIGNTISQDDGLTTFILDGETSRLETLILRNILKCFGEEYKILSEEDFFWSEEDYKNWKADLEVRTNLPWEIYNKKYKGDVEITEEKPETNDDSSKIQPQDT